MDVFIEALPVVQRLSSEVGERKINSLELFFVYNVFTEILKGLNRIFVDWNIHLVRGVTHRGNGFSCETLNLQIITIDQNNFLKELLMEFIGELDMGGVEILVFDIFWPGEIVQAMLIFRYIKEKYPNVITVLSLEHANEQFDFRSYLSGVISESYDYFKDVDYITLTAQDPIDWLLQKDTDHTPINVFVNDGKKFNIRISQIGAGNKTKEVEIGRGGDNILSVEYLFGKRSVNIRLYPFRCYYSACFFCTINHGNDNIFPHNDLDIVRRDVDRTIEELLMIRPYFINFTDEAIHPAILEYFSERILSAGLKINYRFRARFDRKFLDPNFIGKLKLSGASSCGIGLESGSPRLNRLFNKGDTCTLSEKLEIIKEFDRQGISFHNYSIMGFPGENRDESLMTFKFVYKNIDKLDNYSCTPNLYGLMRGSYVFNYPDRFGVEIVPQDNGLVMEFLQGGRSRDLVFLSRLVNEIHKKQFTQALDHIQPRDFWDFIDRTGIFYSFKMIYTHNPFIYPFKVKAAILALDDNSLCQLTLRPTVFFSILTDLRTNRRMIVGLIDYSSRFISKEEERFLLEYSSDKSIEYNLRGTSVRVEFIRFLIDHFILSNYEEDFKAIYNEGV